MCDQLFCFVRERFDASTERLGDLGGSLRRGGGSAGNLLKFELMQKDAVHARNLPLF